MIANAITLIRFALAPVILASIWREQNTRAALLFAVAAFTDFLDGAVARWVEQPTKAGQYLDPVADKVLLCSVFVGLALRGSVPVWYVALVFGRDLAILAASAVAMAWTSYDDYRPTVWGKLSTLFQVLTAVWILAGSAWTSRVLDAGAPLVLGVSAAVTVVSAVHYTWRGVRFFQRR